jgi:dipeptidyl aminopeptidase/acylaminoacyl peptidase
LTFVVTDDRSAYPARTPLEDGPVAKLLKPPVVISSWMTTGARSVVISGGDTRYNEVYAFDGTSLQQITHQNDTLMSQLDLGQTEDVSFTSKDGTEVHGLLTKPVGYVAGTKAPFLLRIHGGPNGQDGHGNGSLRTVMPCSPSTIAAARDAVRRFHARFLPIGAITKWTICWQASIK